MRGCLPPGLHLDIVTMLRLAYPDSSLFTRAVKQGVRRSFLAAFLEHGVPELFSHQQFAGRVEIEVLRGAFLGRQRRMGADGQIVKRNQVVFILFEFVQRFQAIVYLGLGPRHRRTVFDISSDQQF